MSNITEWLKYTLYPSLFESIDTALPEHDFKSFSGGWRSKTYLNGSPHKNRADKTIINRRTPGRILEQGGDNMSLIDYVMKRDSIEFFPAVEKLARIAGVQVPRNSQFDQEAYQKQRNKSTILEDANSYFIWCLENATGVNPVRDYLAGRGYSPEDIKEMELGYIPSQAQLITYLKEKRNHAQADIAETIQFNPGIGSTHSLTIPYRSGGSIKGFKFRTISDTLPKYLNSSGLDRMGGFFNLLGVKGDKDVVVVEGELDSLHATAKGIENVVAAGGDSISREQIADAKSRGAKSFTLCFDTEPGKEAETEKRIRQASQVIFEEGINRVYIVTLPDLGDGKTDPDRLIKERGVEAFRGALSSRLTWGAWLGENLFKEYLGKANEAGDIDLKERDNLRIKAVEIRSGLSSWDRIDFTKTLIEPLANHGFTEDILAELEEDHKTAQEEAAKSKKVEALLRDVNQLQNRGEALELLKEGIKEIDIATGKTLIPHLPTFSEYLGEVATIPPSKLSGYPSLDKFINFTPGAITLIAGRPGHGKTTFLFNLLLNMSKENPEKRFYFFTYEEPKKNLFVKLLNRLIGEGLNDHYDKGITNNYDFLKAYVSQGRTDISFIEAGKKGLQGLIDNQRVNLIDVNYSVEQLSRVVAYLNKKEKVGAIFIDYIQRMGTERRTQDKRTEIAHISNQVLQIAKDTSLPIILGAQFNRLAVSSMEKRPSLENLKEAGNLEEDANTVISVYCEAREKEETEEGKMPDRLVDLEFKTLKNREGEVNRKAALSWDRWTGVIKEQEYKPFR